MLRPHGQFVFSFALSDAWEEEPDAQLRTLQALPQMEKPRRAKLPKAPQEKELRLGREFWVPRASSSSLCWYLTLLSKEGTDYPALGILPHPRRTPPGDLGSALWKDSLDLLQPQPGWY